MSGLSKTLSTSDLGLGPLTEGEARVLDGPSRGQTFSIERQILVGSAKEGVDLRLDDPKVSRKHAQISLGPFGFRVKDLGSRNGTWFAGSRVTELTVPVGAICRFGPVHVALDARHADRGVEMISPAFSHLFSRTKAVLRVLKLAQQVATTDAPVLLSGETGTGKGVLAKAIHAASLRARGKFEVLDCAAVTSSLAQSEWFGYVPGAFTGAVRAHPGVFERAHGGTVLLDELGELLPELQPVLLRVTEQKEVQRLGAAAPSSIDVRLIAATHRDLARDVAEGRFREDLIYRLNVLTLRLPSLRERLDDLPLLAAHFLTAAGLTEPGSIDGPNLARLEAHRWPGNLRELKNVLARAVVQAGPRARFADLTLQFDAGLGAAAAAADETRSQFQVGKSEAIARFEKQYLSELWAGSGGKLKAAARDSGIERTQLRRLLKKHGLL